ncbi:30S ribosomal protein S7 [Candidatus Woesearchaeota archaeon]|nr:30S ribosomal protein S7 [Candidatus Woesearchaeota archaeon]
MAELKIFNKWPLEGIEVEDPGLKKYISLEPRIVPKTGARYGSQRFHKSKVFIVERLINKLMVAGHKGKKHKVTSGRNTGKAASVYNLVETALEKIEQRTKENPVKVFLRALENASPREEIITIEYGGARYPKAVEIAPQRRIDLALRYMVQGSYHSAFGRKKLSVNSLLDEIMGAYNLNSSSNAIAKKFELERQADSSR